MANEKWGAVTLRVSVPAAELFPLLPMTATATFSIRAAELEANRFRVPVSPLMTSGEAATPLGNPVTVTVTGSVKPTARASVTAIRTVRPCGTNALEGATVRLASRFDAVGSPGPFDEQATAHTPVESAKAESKPCFTARDC